MCIFRCCKNIVNIALKLVPGCQLVVIFFFKFNYRKNTVIFLEKNMCLFVFLLHLLSHVNICAVLGAKRAHGLHWEACSS